jgi:hypothetical protein
MVRGLVPRFRLSVGQARLNARETDLRRPLCLVAATILILVVAACGGSASSVDEQHAREDEVPDSSTGQEPDATPAVGAVGAPFPKGLLDTYYACMDELGYDHSIPNQLGLPDGSIYEASGPNRQPPPLSYRNDSFDCKARTGLDIAEAERGFNNYPVDEDLNRRLNEEVIGLVRCMTARGWDIPAPILDKVMGRLTMIAPADLDDRSAYDVELAGCYDFITNGAE